MEAVITKHILETPELAGKEDHVRKFFEKKYNVDPELVSEDELSINRGGLAKEANQAKHELQAVKDKLKVPEPEYAQPPTPPELTTEEKATLNTGWTNVGQKISENLAKLKVPIKNNKDPLLDYELSESEQKEVTDFVARYGVENRMELNEANVHTLSTLVYNQLMMSKLPNIVHSVFEKARNMTEAQVHAMYENPSPAKNEDKPPVDPAGQPTDEEKVQQDIFDAEMGRY